MDVECWCFAWDETALLPFQIGLFTLKKWADANIGGLQVQVLSIKDIQNFINLIVNYNKSQWNWVSFLTDELVTVVIEVSLHLSLEGTFKSHVLLEESENEFIEITWVFNTV